MTPGEQTLWHKIKTFKLDDDQTSFTFSARLARENGWTAEYTDRVIEEYKKFIFLCWLSPSGVTPSDAVDQAWHLHLTYTKSYWVDLCQNILQKEIHHNPTKGGEQEASKFDDYYSGSFKLYTKIFSTKPPADIWPDNETRFSDINFQRVNLRTHGLVKRWVITALQVLLYIAIALVIVTIIALMVINLTPNEYVPVFAFIAFTLIIYASKKLNHNTEVTGNGCGGGNGGCSTDSSHGHGDGHGGHGCSSGCSGCSGSGCSGCGGGGD
jgi:hypothetical protein